jgi:hypothetical protein
MNTKHPHAELMLLYAQDAMETDKPWERWESEYDQSLGNWYPCTGCPNWDSPTVSYRRKPKTISIGNKEVNIGDKLYYNNQQGISFVGTVLELDFESVVPRLALNRATNGNIDKYWIFSDTKYITRVIKIGTYDVPEPLRVVPINGTRCYLASVGYPNQWFCFCKDYTNHVRHLANGTLHLTEEARDFHNKALLSFTTTEINDE